MKSRRPNRNSISWESHASEASESDQSAATATSWSQFPPTHNCITALLNGISRCFHYQRPATCVENSLTWHPLQNLERVKHSDIETLDCTRSPSQMLRNRVPHENNREKPILWSFLRLRDIFTRIFFLRLKTRRIFVWFHFTSIFSIFVRKKHFPMFQRTKNLNICLGNVWKWCCATTILIGAIELL